MFVHSRYLFSQYENENSKLIWTDFQFNLIRIFRKKTMFNQEVMVFTRNILKWIMFYL